MPDLFIERGELHLFETLKKQLANLFHFHRSDAKGLKLALLNALGRLSYAFSFNKCKYFTQNNSVYFNPYHASQYCIFLYFLGYELGKDVKTKCLADRVYYLNKVLNGLDLYHQVKMPDIFFLDHPVGSVIGRATFGNYFSFYQNCTIGQSNKKSPRIGNNVKMWPGSAIVGDCEIGDNVVVGMGAQIKDQSVGSNSLVFGQSPNLIIKSKTEHYFESDVLKLCPENYVSIFE